MLGHPALVAGLDAGDTQRKALLAEQRVAAVTGAERPDFTGFREVGDILLVHRRARPDAVVGFAGSQRFADRMHARDEFAVVAEDIEHLGADAGHHFHVDHDIRGIGDFNADLGDVGADRTHRERDNVHGTALHAAVVQPEHGLLQLFGVNPVVGRTSVFLLFGSDESTGFNAGDVGRVGAEQQAVRALRGIQTDGEAGFDQFVAETIVLFLGAVAPVNRVGLADRNPLIDPLDQFFILGRGSIKLLGHDFLIPPIIMVWGLFNFYIH